MEKKESKREKELKEIITEYKKFEENIKKNNKNNEFEKQSKEYIKKFEENIRGFAYPKGNNDEKKIINQARLWLAYFLITIKCKEEKDQDKKKEILKEAKSILEGITKEEEKNIEKEVIGFAQFYYAFSLDFDNFENLCFDLNGKSASTLKKFVEYLRKSAENGIEEAKDCSEIFLFYNMKKLEERMENFEKRIKNLENIWERKKIRSRI